MYKHLTYLKKKTILKQFNQQMWLPQFLRDCANNWLKLPISENVSLSPCQEDDRVTLETAKPAPGPNQSLT